MKKRGELRMTLRFSAWATLRMKWSLLIWRPPREKQVLRWISALFWPYYVRDAQQIQLGIAVYLISRYSSVPRDTKTQVWSQGKKYRQKTYMTKWCVEVLKAVRSLPKRRSREKRKCLRTGSVPTLTDWGDERKNQVDWKWTASRVTGALLWKDTVGRQAKMHRWIRG